MTGLDALQSVQYVTIGGKQFALLDANDFEALVEWLEDQEDVALAQAAVAQLKASGHDPRKAGWLAWEDARQDLG